VRIIVQEVEQTVSVRVFYMFRLVGRAAKDRRTIKSLQRYAPMGVKLGPSAVSRPVLPVAGSPLPPLRARVHIVKVDVKVSIVIRRHRLRHAPVALTLNCGHPLNGPSSRGDMKLYLLFVLRVL
jgi:hypothetical protein